MSRSCLKEVTVQLGFLPRALKCNYYVSVTLAILKRKNVLLTNETQEMKQHTAQTLWKAFSQSTRFLKLSEAGMIYSYATWKTLSEMILNWFCKKNALLYYQLRKNATTTDFFFSTSKYVCCLRTLISTSLKSITPSSRFKVSFLLGNIKQANAVLLMYRQEKLGRIVLTQQTHII